MPSQSSKTRMSELQRLVPLWPGEISDTSRAGRHRLLNRLRAALRQERRLGLAGHWSYDVARHRQLLEAYRREASALADGTRDRPTTKPRAEVQVAR